MSSLKITIKKAIKDDVIVLKEATEAYYKSLLIEENQSETTKVFQSILQSLYNKFYDAHAKAYKQDEFSFKLMYHEAILIVRALIFFNEITIDSYPKNRALKLILGLDPQTK